MTMVFYDNALRMRIHHSEIYKIHQHLDCFIQEKACVKTPYSFKIIPETIHDSSILLRTAQPLNLPGEQAKEICLHVGDTLRFITTLAVIRHEIVDGRKKQITPPPEQLESYIHMRLMRAGFGIQSLIVGEPDNIIVRKNRKKQDKPVLVPASVIHATCLVNIVEEAEKSLVYGIGRKRIFGFGYLGPFSVNTDDEFY
ncbi:hypothetical protein ACR20V_002512 [Salmonella enterica]|nr:hypothetical protein [Salmonella enterica subsp. enterica serovar Redlands]ECJ4521141.1 hypothetical protein [Salmonella enterica subsp. enterica]